MVFKLLALGALAVAVSASPAPTAWSWSEVTGAPAGLFHSQVDSIQSKSLDTAVLVGELSELLGQYKVLDLIYNNYLAQYKKESTRFYNAGAKAQFKQTLLEIAQHNLEAKQGKFSWTEGVNQFTDMSDEEYTQLLTFKESFETFYARANITVGAPIKATGVIGDDEGKSWRDQITPVKNQGQCGSCYAFSAVGQLEANYNIKNEKSLDLSEQQVVDCSGQGGCNGGGLGSTSEYLKKGITTEAAYPYKTKKTTCKRGTKAAGPVVTSVSRVEGDDGLAEALNSGTVNIAVDAGCKGFQRYKSGVLTDCSDSLNHAVLAIGYGTDESSGEPYFDVKNSWGTSWGNQGFILIKRGANVAGIGQESYAAETN